MKDAKEGITNECNYRYMDFNKDGIYDAVLVKNVESFVLNMLI